MNLPGGPTKDEVMAIALFKSGLQKSDIFLDIGCGTGKVSLNAAPMVKWVYGADTRIEAVNYARECASRAGVQNAQFFCEEAIDFLERFETVDAAFVGGSRDLSRVLTLLAEKEARSVVVNAVLIETMHEAISEMKRLGIFKEAILVSVSRSYPLGRGMMFKPHDPVFVIVGGCAECS